MLLGLQESPGALEDIDVRGTKCRQSPFTKMKYGR